MSGKLNVVVLEPDKEPEARKIAGDLDTLQVIIGGWIEMVPMASKPGAPSPGYLIINEEGKIEGLPVNDRATEIAYLAPGDVIVGPAVLVGPIDGDGEWTDVDATVAAGLLGEVTV